MFFTFVFEQKSNVAVVTFHLDGLKRVSSDCVFMIAAHPLRLFRRLAGNSRLEAAWNSLNVLEIPSRQPPPKTLRK